MQVIGDVDFFGGVFGQSGQGGIVGQVFICCDQLGLDFENIWIGVQGFGFDFGGMGEVVDVWFDGGKGWNLCEIGDYCIGDFVDVVYVLVDFDVVVFVEIFDWN